MWNLIVATRNAHKTREIQQLLGPEFEVRDLSEYPEISETVENGESFEENAKLKAVAVSKKLPGLVIADDSGLEVDALGGAPGIYSARYADAKATDKQNMDRAVEGTIVDRARGSHGFGYDPIFVPNGFEETFGELPAGLKNTISHRARAIRALRAGLQAGALSQGFGGGGGAPGG